MSVINQYNLYFNTNYRNSSTVDYPFFNLVKPISLSSSNNFFEIALTSASIPFAWYILRSPDTTINYRVNAGFTTSTAIPAGLKNKALVPIPSVDPIPPFPAIVVTTPDGVILRMRLLSESDT